MSIRPKGKNNIFQGDTLPYPLYSGVHPPPPPNPFHVTLGATQGATQSLPTVFPVKWIYITMRLQLN